MDRMQHPTPTTLRMRIAETRVKQHRIAARLDISDAHLSHLLTERKPASDEMLLRIAEAIEDVAAEVVA